MALPNKAWWRKTGLGVRLAFMASLRMLGFDVPERTVLRLLDHVIVLNERHLKRLMTEYVCYYHEDRTHLGLQKQTAAARATVLTAIPGSRVVSMPRLGGLHHHYDLAA